MAENVKVSKFAKARKKTIRFFKDIRSELKKVIWPTKEQMVNNTLTVLFACLVIGVVIWVVDFGLTKLVELALLK